ncbi:PH domain-containing protein [Aquibacillus koreensis]|uniref:PH domain-containing protein n=1 Tax=Aquibacillus koreensis TaxID=279446 RepID=A0A9X3WJP1_9BACI|nr:PH domain-containing protein [Aquibacillus koreensis]MCT2535148.1 PH domain-containing protein [Aquibacillus koreensis]MDC3421007.1 PH domain-containing protein [Aquibacillus koreensis]
MSNSKRLHPAAMIFNVINLIRQFVYALIPVIVLSIGDAHFIYVMLGGSVLCILVIVHSVLNWFRFTYKIEDDQLLIEQGVFIRKNRTISKNRIQSIDLTQNIIHRIFGLTKVQIETAGSDSNVDATLSAVTFDEGQYIHQELKRKKEPSVTNDDSTEPEHHNVRNISFKRLLIAGSTSGSFGVILGIFAFAFSEVENLIPESTYERTTNWLISQTIQLLSVLGLVLVLLTWAIGILGVVIKHGKFTVTRYEDELFITRGLLEKRQMTIPIKRIQAVSIKESLIRQPLGFASISVEIAGGVHDNQPTETLIFPLLKKKEISSFLQDIVPEYQDVPSTFKHIPKRGLPYYLFRASILPILAIIPLAIMLPDFVFIPCILVILSLLVGFARYRTAGIHLTKNQLTLQMRLFSKETVVLKQRRIQAFEKQQHVLHRKQKLANMEASILNNFTGRHYSIKELTVEDVDRIVDWFSCRK